MQFVATLSIQRLIPTPQRLIVVAVPVAPDGSEEKVVVYVVDAARIDPDVDEPILLTFFRSNLGAQLKRIIDDPILPLSGDVSNPQPPPIGPKLILQYAASLRIDNPFMQVEITQTGTTVASLAAASADDPKASQG